MEGNTHCYIRKLRHVPTRTPNTQSLQHWGSQLKGQWRRTFKRKYENLLSLVNVQVQLEALSAHTQYYDLPLRCFTFQEFQLAPTLEEYDRLMGMAYHESPPYLFGGDYPSWATIARLFKVPESVVVELKKNQNGVEGILEVVFEARLQQLQEEGDWLTFVDVYGLLVYGIILFPHIECYVDLATIDTFFSKRDKGEHPIVAEERKGIKVLYIVALLVVDRAPCGGFPNISLMGTKGAINCNSKLALRQVGYPMILPPSKKVVTPFILHDLGAQKGECLRKIRQAWKKVVKKEPEWGLLSYGASSSYKSWLWCKLETTFLTFSDPRFETIEDESVSLQRPLKRKCRELDSQQCEERFREREFEEELTAALEDTRSREGSAKNQIRQLQEQIDLLKEEVVGHRLRNEYLERKKSQGLLALAEERRKTTDSGLRADATIQKF
ncbi:hypothetical protein CR513_42169, partial [Mucuna pruriens]